MIVESEVEEITSTFSSLSIATTTLLKLIVHEKLISRMEGGTTSLIGSFIEQLVRPVLEEG